jgi:hypothetical protein
MENEPAPEFAIRLEPTNPLSAEVREAIDDKLLGVRGQVEYYYAQQKKIERRNAAALGEATAREKETAGLIKELLRVTDSFEDIFRSSEEDKKLRKQTQALEAFEITYDTLLHVLENHSVHKVPLRGKAYSAVEFRGTKIFEPWTVVDARSGAADGNDAKVARRVLRSLWIRETPQGIQILRRGQVVY